MLGVVGVVFGEGLGVMFGGASLRDVVLMLLRLKHP